MLGKPSRNKGTKLSDKSKGLISKNNGRYWAGKHISEDTKNKIREKRASQDMTYRNQPYILCSPEGKEVAFPSVTEILYALGIKAGAHFYHLVQGDLKEINGWKFVRKGAVNGNNHLTSGHGSL